MYPGKGTVVLIRPEQTFYERIMLAGVYSTYSKWINKEIEIPKEVFTKPIVAVEPWGSKNTSKVVKDNADAIVKWRSSSIVEAIRKYSI